VNAVLRGWVSLQEMLVARQIAEYEYDRARARNLPNRLTDPYFTPERMKEYAFQAYCAQFAVARWWGIEGYCPDLESYKNAPDVPPFWEVRHASNPNRDYAIVKPSDRDGDRMIFVRGWPELELVGYMPIKLAKERYPLVDDKGWGAYHKIPVEDLWPL